MRGKKERKGRKKMQKDVTEVKENSTKWIFNMKKIKSTKNDKYMDKNRRVCFTYNLFENQFIIWIKIKI